MTKTDYYDEGCGCGFYDADEFLWIAHVERCPVANPEVTDSDLIANISRGEEALKGIEPGATFEIADLYGKEN